jgi:hypothetical protein
MNTTLPPRVRANRVLQLAVLGGTVALALAACTPVGSGPAVSGPAAGGDPIPVDGGPASADCLAAFPDNQFGSDLASTPTVPADWPEPSGVELCVALQTTDYTAVLQYVTDLEPDAVLDAWEPLLAGYQLERSPGIGDYPILNATGGDLEFAIQTVEDGTVLVAFQAGAA